MVVFVAELFDFVVVLSDYYKLAAFEVELFGLVLFGALVAVEVEEKEEASAVEVEVEEEEEASAVEESYLLHCS